MDLVALGLEIRSRGLQEGLSRLRDLQMQGGRTERSIDGVSSAVSGLQKVVAAVGVAQLTRSMYNAVSSAQSLQASLKTVTGSTEAAGAAWSNLLEFAKTTPFTLDQSVNAFIRMKSLGLEPTEEALTSFGNTASAMGKDLMQFVEAVADAVTGENERLKEFGIRANKLGDDIAYTFQGTTTVVKNNSEAIQEYLENIGNTAFAGSMSDQMATLNGQAANLEDSIYQLWLAIGDAGATDVFSSGMNDASDAVNRLQAAVDGGVFDWIFDAYNRINASGNEMIEDLGDIASGAVMLADEFKRALLLIQANFFDLKASALEAMGGIALGSAQAINQGLIPIQMALNYLDQTFANLIENIADFLGPLGGGLSEYAESLRSNLIDPVGITTELFYDNAVASRESSDALRAQADMIGKAGIELRTLDGWLLKSGVSTDSLKKATDGNTQSAKEAAKAAKELARQVEEQQKAIQSLFGDVNKSGKAWGEYRDNLVAIRQPTSYLINPTLEMAAAIGVNAMQLNEALRASDPYAQKLDQLAGKYQATGTKAQELSKDISALREGIDRTGDPTGQLTVALGEAQREMGELAEESDALQTAMTRAVERMDDSFVDFWENTLSGAENTFDSFKDLAISTLAEIIHAYTTRQITAQLSAVINPQGAKGAAGSIPGMGGTGGIGDLGSIGQNVYKGITDGFGSINWTGMGGSQGYASGFGANVATQNSFMGTGGTFRNFGGATGLASMGAGFGGNMLGNAVFGDSEYGSTLSTIGAGVGTFFGGPVGAAIGGFAGSALGSLFGDSEREPFAKTWSGAQNADPKNFYRDYFRNTDLGTVGILDKQKMDPEPLIEWVNAIEEIDNKIASMLDQGQLESVRAELANPDKYKGTDLSEVTVSRYERTLDALADSSGEVTRKLIEKIGDVTKDNIESQLEKLGQSLQLGGLVEGLTGNVREYADRVIDANSDLESAFAEIQAGAQNFAGVSDLADRLNLMFDDTAAGAVDAANGLTQLLGGLDNLQSQAESYYQTYFSEQERQQRIGEQIAPVLAEYNLSLESNLQQFRAQIEALDLNTDAGRSAYAALMSVSSAFYDVVTASEEQREALKREQEARQRELEGYHRNVVKESTDAVKSFFDRFVSSVENERDVLRDAFESTSERIGSNIDRINDSMREGERAVDALSGALSTMFGSQQQTLGGRGAAQQYLSTVAASGKVSDYESLEKALGIISQPSEDLYSSFADYQSDFYSAASLIGGIKNNAETQLSAQERSINALEHQLAQAEAQYNMESDKLDQMVSAQAASIEAQLGQLTWLQQINGSVLSIPDAITRLALALGEAERDRISTGHNDLESFISSARGSKGYLDDSGAMQVYEYLRRTGGSLSDADKYLQDGARSATQWASDKGLPMFAKGGSHEGGWRVVGERGPELEWTAPSKIMNSGASMNAINTEAVRQAVDQMRTELGGYMRDIMLSNGEMNLTLNDWDGVGLPQTRDIGV